MRKILLIVAVILIGGFTACTESEPLPTPEIEDVNAEGDDDDDDDTIPPPGLTG